MRKYSGTGEASSTKGSRHPDGISAGREVPGSGSGSQGEKLSTSGGGTGSRPSGVRSNSGTEQRKSDPSTKTALPTSARPSGDESRRPSGVRAHGGKSAPKSVS